MCWRVLAFLALSVLLCCEHTSRTAKESAAVRPDRPQDDLGELQREIAVALADAEQHLRSFTMSPSGHELRACPDSALARQAAGGGPLKLVVRAFDARVEAKNLLPLEIIARLETDDFARALRHLRGGRAALWDPSGARPVSLEAGESALEDLRRLRATRLVAEVRILEYTAPHLFIRKGALRYQWAAGSLAFDLVVHDLTARSVLCQAPVVVRGDATAAPVRRRLRERTRLSLQRQLADRAWAATGDALGRISARLALPDQTLRATPSQRFSSGDRLASNITGS
ncbi:MAG: hypothetical protein JW940_39310 [Polyangiaceae bacterium]|nr:hypothetical protein [Polyangiaceae bacterium]